jgi:hypothetical protein
MKKSITLAALLLAFGTSVFALPGKSKHHGIENEVAFVPLKSDGDGFGVMVDKPTPGKSVLIVYDNDHNVIYKDLLSKNAQGAKEYSVANLEDGDYTVEIVTDKQSEKKQMHVYEDGQEKSYIFLQ